MTLPVTFDDIERAAQTLHGHVVRTPCAPAPRLSTLCGASIVIKYENMQATGSFKDRGAFAKLQALAEAERRRGVIAISAGNHAQAVAYWAGKLGVPSTIVMPEFTPFNKVSNTEAYGATVILSGESLHECRDTADRLQSERGLTVVHPYDDPAIIAGQGTAGLEFLTERPDLDCLVIPIGGGGLISGCAIAAKALKPGIEVIGVEVASYAATRHALRGGCDVTGGPTLAEGIAVKGTGTHTLPIIKELVSDIILAGERAVEDAVFTYATVQKTVAEGASAAALAAVLGNPARFQGRTVGCIQCGGNIDPRVLASVMIRGLERESRVVSLRITIHDRPGVLGDIASVLGRVNANILEVDHRRLYLDVPAKGAVVDILIETKDHAHAEATIKALRDRGYDVCRMQGLRGEA
jgi:threonine dehydratase